MLLRTGTFPSFASPAWQGRCLLLVNGMHRFEYLDTLILDENTKFAFIIVNGSNLRFSLLKSTSH